jgi:hypothetical protein
VNALLGQAGPFEATAVRGTPNRHRVKIAALTQMRVDFAELGHGMDMSNMLIEYPFSRFLKEIFYSVSPPESELVGFAQRGVDAYRQRKTETPAGKDGHS